MNYAVKKTGMSPATSWRALPSPINEPIMEEVRWTDDSIRWEGGLKVDMDADKRGNASAAVGQDGDDGGTHARRDGVGGVVVDGEEESSDDEEAFVVDPFADPDPFELFEYEFKLPTPSSDVTSSNSTLDINDTTLSNVSNKVDDSSSSSAANTINIQIRGYKTDAEQIWQSTGLTLWRASHYLCQYTVENSAMFVGKRVLELGAGLGLNGILAWRMMDVCGADSEDGRGEVCITDGDSDALVHLRDNIERNRPSITAPTNDDVDINNTDRTKVSCHQLIWGKQSSLSFLQHHTNNQKYNLLLASDIIYAVCIIEPLWETVQTLLDEHDGVFVMAFARRKVPVSIELVLESAVEKGFEYELAKEDLEEGIWVYLFRHVRREVR